MISDCETILAAFIQQAIAIISIIFNFSIVWITIRNRNLQNIYGVMLAIYSVCEVSIQAYLFLQAFMILTDTKIPLMACFYVTALPFLWTGLSATFTLLFISLDRLIAMLFPLFYQFYGSVKLISILYFILTGYMLIMMYFVWLYVLEHQEIIGYCEPGDQFGGPDSSSKLRSWIYSNFTIAHSLIFVIYIFLGIYLKLKKSTGIANNQMAKTQRIFKSLAIIMCTVLSTYFLGFIGIQFVVPLLANYPLMASIYKHISVHLVSVGSAINAPVLYICSSEYRNAMNSHFPFIPSMMKVCGIFRMNSNTVQVVQPMVLATTNVQTSPAYVSPP